MRRRERFAEQKVKANRTLVVESSALVASSSRVGSTSSNVLFRLYTSPHLRKLSASYPVYNPLRYRDKRERQAAFCLNFMPVCHLMLINKVAKDDYVPGARFDKGHSNHALKTPMD